MKIAHVVPTYLPATRYGGPIHSVHGLCRGLVELGHEVDVFTTSVDGPSDSDVPLGEPVELDGVRITYFASRFGRRLYFAPALKAALDGSIRRYDALHVHSVFLWPTNAAASAARAAGVPYVLSPRGMLVPELVAQRSARLKTAWLTLIESRTLAGAAHIHFTSERELSDARRMPLPLPSPRVVPNGVRGPERSSAALSARIEALVHGPPFALYLGRLSWKKGLPLTINAIARGRGRLVICGPDDEGLTEPLRALTRKLGCADRVRFEDAVAGADKWALLEAARCVVLASDNENFGNVVPEAMWMGTPLVVSDHTGAGEVVSRADAGFVCARDEGALAAAIERLFDDAGLRAAQGERGRAYARRELSWTHVAERMLDVYRVTR